MAHIPAERCLGILELLAADAGEMPLGEIAERLDLPKSGAHRLLTTLVDLGWADQDRLTGFYRLSMRLAILGQRFYLATGVPDVCQPLLDRLADECREFARLAVVDGNALTWIAHAQGATGGLVYLPAEVTQSVPLYATASGKAWLSTMTPEQSARKIVEQGGFEHADRYGPNVIRSMDVLQRELRATARRGYGIALSEAEPGVSAIAAVVRSGPERAAVGTVSIAGPGVRVTETRVHELAPRVVQCAAELSSFWPLRRKRAPGVASDAVGQAA